MKTTVCLPTELGSAEIDRWRQICARRLDLDSPFLAPEFTLAVGRSRPAARVAVVEDGGRIVAFFPFEQRPLGLGVPIGADLCDFQAIVCEPELDVDVCDLLARCHLEAWHFDHLVSSQRVMCAPNACEADSPFIDLSAGYDACFARTRYRNSKILQHERKLGREVGPIRFGYAVCDAAALDKMFEWKSEQYKRTGRPDRFASRSNVQLIRELAQTATPDLSGTLITFHAGDRLVAVEFSLRSETVLAGWFPAYDCGLSRYSPGSARTLRTLEAASNAGVKRYDLGKGEEEYKQWFKDGDLRVCEGWMLRPTMRARVRRSMSIPRETVLDFVLRHHRLRLAARATLSRLGSARIWLARKTGPSPRQN